MTLADIQALCNQYYTKIDVMLWYDCWKDVSSEELGEVLVYADQSILEDKPFKDVLIPAIMIINFILDARVATQG